MSTERVDLLTRIISTIVPATVAECAKRFPQLEQFRSGKGDLMGLVEKVSGDLVTECDFDVDVDDSNEEPDHMPKSAILTGVANTGDLSHIQNLKLDLYEIMQEMKHDLMEEFRGALKDELRMELFMELQRLQSGGVSAEHQSLANTPSHYARGVKKEFATGTMSQFSVELPAIDSTSSMTSVLNGFDSISDKVSFGMSAKTSADIEQDLLINNPLFAKITRNLERVKNGKAADTAEELIEARRDRFDIASIDDFKKRVDGSNYQYESGDNGEDSRWDRLLKDKLSAGI